tara:strand:+ start:46 stop:312 length:267 start_codon:yes stop_codon:yes gene_type:complete
MTDQNKENLYLVVVATGSYDDYFENIKFATEDEEKALLWVNKFNRILEENKDRLNNYCFTKDQEKEPFWYDFVHYQEPNALIRKTELK